MLKVEKRKMGLERVQTPSTPSKVAKLSFLDDEINEIASDIRKKEAELESILLTPQRHNRTPESANKK